MKIFNTMSGRKEKFRPLIDGKVGMYVCGPTVYDFGHLGHGRSAVSFDVIRKYLIYKGYDVNFVTNYTDIDDKMINRAELMKISVKELAEKIIPKYEHDYGDLGVMKGDFQPNATEYVNEIVALIKKLEENGFTYAISDGIYYDVMKFEDYGKLSKQKLDDLRSGARVELNTEKRNPQDFVVWKFAKPGEPKWDSPWGEGRPGWHIECSAMSWKLLGESFDIHGGGADLMFPHHECEIAQSEGAFGVPFVKYWMHNGFVRIDNEKMSKSLNNFFTLRDIFKEFNPMAVRYLFLQTHYRSPIDFSKGLLEQAENSLERVHDFMRRLKSFKLFGQDHDESEFEQFLSSIKERFEAGMDDDFETPKALAACFDLIKELNKRMNTGDLSDESKNKTLSLITSFDSVLGIFVKPDIDDAVDDEIEALMREREIARENRDYKRSDEIRDFLMSRGIILEDTPEGTVWKRRS